MIQEVIKSGIYIYIYIYRQIRLGKIKEARYNKKYEEIIKEELPDYLRKDFRDMRIDIEVRIRGGNDEKISNYWLDVETKKCRLCGKEKETFKHLIEVF